MPSSIAKTAALFPGYNRTATFHHQLWPWTGSYDHVYLLLAARCTPEPDCLGGYCSRDEKFAFYKTYFPLQQVI